MARQTISGRFALTSSHAVRLTITNIACHGNGGLMKICDPVAIFKGLPVRSA